MKARWTLRERGGGGLLCALAAPELTLLQALRQSHNCKFGMNIMKDPDFERWTISHSSPVRMKGLRKNRAKFLRRISHFTNGFYTAAKTQRDLSSTLGKITENIIYRNKSDSLAKTVAALQVFWVLVQTIVRYFESLPVSQLEFVARTYIVCPVPMFYLWIPEPYDVR